LIITLLDVIGRTLKELEVTEREALIVLNMMEGMGPITVSALVESLGSAVAVFTASAEELMSARGVGQRIASSIIEQRGGLDWEGEIAECQRLGVRLIVRGDAEYPQSLLAIHDPPLVLYVRGELMSRDSRAIAVVGTRKPTHYGRESAARLSGQIAGAGYTVISGLAEGVDTIAHRQALAMRGRTIGVIGSGMKHMYPASNMELAGEIVKNGAVISEFPLDRKPDKTTFPIRNRIVTGLSAGVLVVEAGIKSGAMITARLALEQGRDVFAVPGRIDSPLSSGTNGLIKQGAKLVESAADILEEYEELFPHGGDTGPSRREMQMTSDEREVVMLLEQGEMPVDVLIRETGMQPGAMSSLLVGLEIKRAVQMLPGQMVALKRN
jgi:DNA processing protein